MKSRLLVKSIWFEKEKDHILMTRNDSKSWKVSHNLHSPNLRKLYWLVTKTNAPWPLNANLKIWMPYKKFNPIQDGSFWAAQVGSGTKRLPPKNLSHISYNDETWHRVTQIPYHNNETWCSYTLSKEVLKIYKLRDGPLSSPDISIINRKLAAFAVSRNTDKDCILVHNF